MYVRPAYILTGLQRRRRRQRAVGKRLEMDALGEAGGELRQRLIVFGQGSALVRGRRRTGVTQADAPMIAGWDQYEWEQSTRQRLGFVAEAFVYAATPLVAEKNAAAIGTVIEPPLARPRRTLADERDVTAEVGVAVPALGLNALAFLVGDGDDVFLTTGAADVAIPVLQDRQMADRERHGQTGI